ncbi:unannotated protein [freshwater metagenome]|uniref:Unannotated protein n=1 Tax=freshwater metagenome TaxID=449393 RepID=A0A6J7S5T5_9ZZZZ
MGSVNQRDAIDPSWVARVIAAPPGVGPVRLVCVDGPAGSGKTTFASAFAAALTPHLEIVHVVHGDAVYEGWDVVADAPDRIAAFSWLATRIEQWLIDPWRLGRAGEHPVWDWHTSRWGSTQTVTCEGVVILEGVGLGSRALREQAALSVWVEADPTTRLARVLRRDGDAIGDHMRAWQSDEEVWHQIDATRDGSDLRIATS